MLNKVQNVYNENCSIIINNYENSTITNLLYLDENFAYDLRNILEIIRDTATATDGENADEAFTSFFRIRSLANVLLDKIKPENFDELHDLLNKIKI